MGGGKGSSSVSASPYEESLAKMAEELYSQTSGMRGNLIGELEQVSSGQYDPTKSAMFSPMFAQAKQGVESQYGLAKENILANTARGGAQTGSLANLEMSRAGQASELPAMISQNILSDMMGKTYGVAFGTPQQSMSGLGTVASTFGQKQSQAMASDSAENAAKYQAIGLGAGGFLGGK